MSEERAVERVSRTKLILLLPALLCPAPLGCAEEGVAQRSRFDRVILIVVDTLRRDHVWPYEERAPTPNIRRIVERGQALTNSIASFHQTTMSMAALFTGLTPSIESTDRRSTLDWHGRNWCGMARFASPARDECVPLQVDTLAEDLRDAGYWTMGIVSTVFLHRPSGFDQGFDDWVELGGREGDVAGSGRKRTLAQVKSRQGEQVNDAVIGALARRPKDRFFLYVHYMDVHDAERLGHSYESGVVQMDRHLGVLLDELERTNLLDGALLIFTSDHGEIFDYDKAIERTRRHFGNPSFEPVLEVPLIVAPPMLDEPDRYVRSQDLRGLIGQWIWEGGESEPAAEEQIITELGWITYRHWPWKSTWKRDGSVSYLFDLRTPRPELHDQSARRKDVKARHEQRISELLVDLRAQPSEGDGLTEEDAERLRALGYAE